MKPFLMSLLRYIQQFLREYFRNEALPFVCWRATFDESEMVIEDGTPVLKVTLTIRWNDVTEKEVTLTKKFVDKTKYGLIIHGIIPEEDL